MLQACYNVRKHAQMLQACYNVRKHAQLLQACYNVRKHAQMLRACSKSVLYKRATERKSRGLELCEDEGDFFSLRDLYLYTNNVYLVNRLNSDMRGVSSENVHPLEDHLPRLIQIYTKY